MDEYKKFISNVIKCEKYIDECGDNMCEHVFFLDDLKPVKDTAISDLLDIFQSIYQGLRYTEIGAIFYVIPKYFIFQFIRIAICINFNRHVTPPIKSPN